MASMSTAETSATTAQICPGPAPAKDGNAMTAAAVTTATSGTHCPDLGQSQVRRHPSRDRRLRAASDLPGWSSSWLGGQHRSGLP